jgi:alpha-galactosidase/6-phospho-beta-glucosidase family protein
LVAHHMEQPDVVREFTPDEVKSWGNYFRNMHQLKFELFRRYGILGAAGDRHLAEFVPGFTRSEAELNRWGISMTPISYRIQRWLDAPDATRAVMAGEELLFLNNSGEEGVRQMLALLGRGDLMTNVNVENVGQIDNLPLGAVVETNAYFRRDSVSPICAGSLPSGVQGLVAAHVNNQEMIVEAALTGDKDLAFQAVFNDPTMNLPIDDAWTMFNEMLTASKAYLPGWEIE